MINIQNIDDSECFKWCLIRYLHHADHHPAGIRKVDKDFSKELDFKDIKFLSRLEIFTKWKKKIQSLLAFLVMKIKVANLCLKKCCEEKHVDLLLIGEEG